MTRSVSKADALHYVWGEGCDGWHLLKSPDFSVIQERVPPGAAEVRHYHERARQFFYVLAGTATLEVGDESLMLTHGQGCDVPAGIVHRLRNEGTDELEFLVISVPLAHGDRVTVD